MAKPFFRGTQSELASGAENVVAVVTPLPATYGLTTTQVASYAALSTSFSAKLLVAITPATRTPVAIAAKDAAMALLRDASVDIARIITATPSVTNAQLLELGLNERTVPTPRPVPGGTPAIDVVSVSGRMVTVRIHNPASESRGKPMGAIGANVYSFVGPEAPSDPRVYHYEGLATRSKTGIAFPDSVPSGATVWLCAQWVNARGQMGLGSTPISVTLQGGPVSAAA